MRKFSSDTITTAVGGAATGYIKVPRDGFIHGFGYVKDGGANPYDGGVDFTVTLETTGIAVLAVTNISASEVWYPRAGTCDTSGNAEHYNDADDNAVNDRVPIAGERVKIVVAQGDDDKVGTFFVLVDDM